MQYALWQFDAVCIAVKPPQENLTVARIKGEGHSVYGSQTDSDHNSLDKLSIPEPNGKSRMQRQTPRRSTHPLIGAGVWASFRNRCIEW